MPDIFGPFIRAFNAFTESGYLRPVLIACMLAGLVWCNTVGETRLKNQAFRDRLEYASLADNIHIDATAVSDGPLFMIPNSDYFEWQTLFHPPYTKTKALNLNQFKKTVTSIKNFKTEDLALAKYNVFLLTSGQMTSSRISHLGPLIKLEAQLETLFPQKNLLNVYGVKTSFSYDGLSMYGKDAFRNNGFMNQFHHMVNPTKNSVPYRIRLLQPYGKPDAVYHQFQQYMRQLNTLAVTPFNKIGFDRSHMYVITDRNNRITSVVSSATHIDGKWLNERLEGEYFIPSPRKIMNAILRKEGLAHMITNTEAVLSKAPLLKDGRHDIVNTNIEFTEWAFTTDFVGMIANARSKVKERFKAMLQTADKP